ncbi:MAG: hypothetical protein AAF494_08365 [Pseudomonadota bacterium]
MYSPRSDLTRPQRSMARAILAGAGFSIALLGYAPAALQAQDSPGSFTLPEATPTPTPVPQGPVDVRNGVPIAPRVIPDEQPTSTPTPAPTPSASPAASATPAPAPAPAPAQQTPLPTQLPTQLPAPSEVSRPQADNALAPSGTTAEPSQAPAQSQTASPPSSAAPSPTAAPSLAPPPIELPDETPSAPQPSTGPLTTRVAEPASGLKTGDLLWVGLAIGWLGLVGALIWWLMRRRQKPSAPRCVPVKPTAPAPTPKVDQPDEPVRLELDLDIAGATRSVMMFTLDFRLTLSNRSDRAVRDLALSAKLVCAQRSGSTPEPTGGLAELEPVARIGPHQSRSVRGQLQLPLREVQAILQRNRPLFVPLLQVHATQGTEPPIEYSFVIGSPSASSQSRIHPIPLDTPPGSVQGLRARQVKTEPASAKAA